MGKFNDHQNSNTLACEKTLPSTTHPNRSGYRQEQCAPQVMENPPGPPHLLLQQNALRSTYFCALFGAFPRGAKNGAYEWTYISAQDGACLLWNSHSWDDLWMDAASAAGSYVANCRAGIWTLQFRFLTTISHARKRFVTQ